MKKSGWFITSLLCLVTLIARNPHAFFRAEFWAEDGVVYFNDALIKGVSVLFVPIGGYQNLIPRLVALLGAYLPVLWVPYFYATFSFVVSALMIGFFASDGFAWLIPQRGLRVLACLIFSIAPGTCEVTQALCNLHTVFCLFAFFLVLHQPFSFNIWKNIIWVLLLLSTPELPLLIPLLFIFWKFQSRKEYLILALLIVVVTAWNAYSSKNYASSDYGLRLEGWYRWLPFALERSAVYSLFLPWMGPVLASKFFQLPGLIFWPLSLFSAVGFFRFIRKKVTNNFLFSVIVYFCLAGGCYFVLVFVTRPYVWPELPREVGKLFWQLRFGFNAVCLATIVWFVGVSLFWEEKGTSRIVATLFAMLITAHFLLNPSEPAPRPNLNWHRSAQQIKEQLELVKAGAGKDLPPVFVGLQPNAFRTFPVELSNIARH